MSQKQANILLVLLNTSPVKGEVVTLEIVCQKANEDSQAQVDVFSCGVENPKEVWSKGTANQLTGEHLCELALETKDLSPPIQRSKS